MKVIHRYRRCHRFKSRTGFNLSDHIFTTAEVVFITTKIVFVFIYQSVVLLHDFHMFTAVIKEATL